MGYGKKRLVIIIFFIININPIFFASTNNQLFDNLKKEVQINQKDILVVAFFNSTTCAKSYYEQLQLVETIEEVKRNINVKYIGLFICDRDIEANSIKNKIGWKYFAFRDDGSAYKELKVKSNSIISVFSFENKLLLNLVPRNDSENKSKIKSFFEKYHS
jgi:hypothetical protein